MWRPRATRHSKKMSVNLKFQADVNAFAQKLNVKLHTLTQHIVTRLHGDLGDATPYLTGRARASWNISEDKVDPAPAPPLPFTFADQFNPTGAELAAANAFYDPIYEQKHATQLSQLASVVFISNNVDYIELLNAGWSKQAPPMFFEATVANMENMVNQEIARLAAT